MLLACQKIDFWVIHHRGEAHSMLECEVTCWNREKRAFLPSKSTKNKNRRHFWSLNAAGAPENREREKVDIVMRKNKYPRVQQMRPRAHFRLLNTFRHFINTFFQLDLPISDFFTKALRTNGQTDQRTDGPTDGRKDAAFYRDNFRSFLWFVSLIVWLVFFFTR